MENRNWILQESHFDQSAPISETVAFSSDEDEHDRDDDSEEDWDERDWEAKCFGSASQTSNDSLRRHNKPPRYQVSSFKSKKSHYDANRRPGPYAPFRDSEGHNPSDHHLSQPGFNKSYQNRFRK